MVKQILKQIGLALLALALCFTSVFGRQLILSLSAEDKKNIVEAYEQTNVSDNLKGSVIAGKEFVLEDYPHDENGKPQLLSLVEFCYSYYDEKQSDYGLYVYFYNPQDSRSTYLQIATKYSLRSERKTDIPNTRWSF